MTKRPNALLYLIDALRFDVVADIAAMRVLTPALARVAERGITRRVVANAQSTQFVLPSLFSQTYPLDYGGYNNGIRERPATFVECLQNAGYETHLVGTCNQMGISLSYDRGFDTVHSAVDYRHLIRYRIEKTLQYEISLIDRGEQTEAEAIGKIVTEMRLLLETVLSVDAQLDKSMWPRRLRKLNDKIVAACPGELKILEETPESIIWKLRSLPSGLVWRSLGLTKIGRFQRLYWRIRESLNWRSREFFMTIGFPLFPLGYIQTLASDATKGLQSIIAGAKKSWFVHTHFMDAHDCRSLSRPLRSLYRLKFLPRWLGAKRANLTQRKFLYDAALMDVDEQFEKLLNQIEADGQLENTIIVITGDHGYAYAYSPRNEKKDLGFRTHFEDIDVGLIVAGGDLTEAKSEGLVDSMAVTATLLDILEVPPHPSFKGRSLLRDTRTHVVSENGGRGNADLERRDLFFTVTSEKYKLMAALKGDTLVPSELYDLSADPLELSNLVEDSSLASAKEALLSVLKGERADLFAMRGLVEPSHAASAC